MDAVAESVDSSVVVLVVMFAPCLVDSLATVTVAGFEPCPLDSSEAAEFVVCAAVFASWLSDSLEVAAVTFGVYGEVFEPFPLDYVAVVVYVVRHLYVAVA